MNGRTKPPEGNMKINRHARDAFVASATDIAALQTAVEDAIAEFNDAVGKCWDAVEEAVDNYNAELEELRDSIGSMRDELQGEWDAKSERWQVSDKGEAASNWIETLGEKADEMEQIEVMRPDEIDVPDFPDVRDIAEKLPLTPEE